MSRHRFWHIALAVLLFPVALWGQRENDIWYFGAGAGIDFNGGGPVAITGAQLRSLEGCASIADARTGELLFYTDGAWVWNRAHRPMPAGRGLNGDISSTQSALILPMPGDSAKYYIFTTDSKEDSLKNGLQYSIVDMRLDRGTGDVATRNIPLLAPATEKLTAVRCCNGIDYWVIGHGWENNRFYAWKITAAGISPPVISGVGVVHGASPTSAGYNNCIGYMKPSHDGRKLAVAIFELGLAQLLDFDASTGAISNPITLASPIAGGQSYGIAFSPDDSRLYVSEALGGIFQYDISSGNEATILATRYPLILYPAISPDNATFGALMGGPDGRIYCALNGLASLGVIDSPNAPGAAAGLRYKGFDLGGARCAIGLPNMVDSYSPPVLPRADGDTAICQGTTVPLHARGGIAYQWSPAEGLSCADCPDPMASPSRTTVYTVTATNANGCQGTDSVRVVVHPNVTIRVGIPRDLHLLPGTRISVPVLIADPTTLSTFDSIIIGVGYQRNMIRIRSIITEGTALDGWEVHSPGDVPGELRLLLTRPPGIAVGTGDTLIRLDMAAYVGDTIASELPLTLALPESPCTTVETAAGRIALDSICGLGLRLIQPIVGGYALRGNAPNPFSTTTTIEFSLGLDGPTTLTIADARGATVATLLDATMEPGAYSIVWDGALLPAGTYYCTLTSGEWSGAFTMMIVR